jgi:large subunit ribosomal protein L23
MNVETATKIILRPYITEKTYALVENEQKICFLVEKEATKPQIVEAVKTLYNEDAINVKTARTIYGKRHLLNLILQIKQETWQTKSE